MAGPHRVRESSLLDAIEALHPVPQKRRVWRVVRDGKDVLMPSAAGGRWDDGTFEVLYTAAVGDGAVAEMHFHLSAGLPVIPSKIAYHLFEVQIETQKSLVLPDLAAISALGADASRYGLLSYIERVQEYPRTQEIAEAAHFLGFDSLVVPNARWDCMNVVLFADRLAPAAYEVVRDHGAIDWGRWRAGPYGF